MSDSREKPEIVKRDTLGELLDSPSTEAFPLSPSTKDLKSSSKRDLNPSRSNLTPRAPTLNTTVSEMVVTSHSKVPYDPDARVDFYSDSSEFFLSTTDQPAPSHLNFSQALRKAGKGAVYFSTATSVLLEIFFARFLGEAANEAAAAILDCFLGEANSVYAKKMASLVIWGTTIVNWVLDVTAVNWEQDAYEVLHENPAAPKEHHHQKERLKLFNMGFCFVGWAALAQADLDGMSEMFNIKTPAEQVVLSTALGVFGITYYYMFSKTQVEKHADAFIDLCKEEAKKSLPIHLADKVCLFIEKYKTPLIVMFARGVATGGIMHDLITKVMEVEDNNIGAQLATIAFALIGTYAAAVSRSLRAMKPYQNDEWTKITYEEYKAFRKKSTYTESLGRMINWGTLTDLVRNSCMGALIWHNLEETLPMWVRVAASGIPPAVVFYSSLNTSLVTRTLNQIDKEKKATEEAKEKEKTDPEKQTDKSTVDIPPVREIKKGPDENKYPIEEKKTQSPPIAKDERTRISFAAHPSVWGNEPLEEFVKVINSYTKGLEAGFEKVSWTSSRGEVKDQSIIDGLSRKVKESNLVIVATSSPTVKEACDRLRGDPKTKASIKIIFEESNGDFDWTSNGKHRKLVISTIRQFLSQQLFLKIGDALYKAKEKNWLSIPTLVKGFNYLSGVPRLLSNYYYIDTVSDVLAGLTGMDALDPDCTTKTLAMMAFLLQMVRGDRQVYFGELEKSYPHYLAKFRIGSVNDEQASFWRQLWLSVISAQQEYDPEKLFRVYKEVQAEIAAAEVAESKTAEWGVTSFFRRTFTRSAPELKQPLLGDEKRNGAAQDVDEESPEPNSREGQPEHTTTGSEPRSSENGTQGEKDEENDTEYTSFRDDDEDKERSSRCIIL